MISLADVYHVLEAIIPLYVAMILAYISAKWWKLFTLDQCSGINKFVAKFSIPLLSFSVISNTNPYQMNLKLLLSDSLQKLLAFLLLAAFTKLSSRGNLDWVITGVSVSTLPNTLILGIPLLKAMYGDEATALLTQIVVFQSLIWYNLLLFLYEFRAAEAVSVTPSLEATGQSVAPQGAQLKEGEETRATTTRKLKTKQILLTVGRKLISNPNTHATLVGLIWAFIHYRWGPDLPVIIHKSISILSDGGLGMAMFSLGLFMASQAKIIACGTWMAALAMGTRFLVGPALMAISSLAFGLRSTLFKVAVMQCVAGSSSSRDCSICVCNRVQCASRHPEHWGHLWHAYCNSNSNILLFAASLVVLPSSGKRLQNTKSITKAQHEIWDPYLFYSFSM